MSHPGAAKPLVRVRRVYEAPEAEDGQRVLVDRLWPRGLTKEAARLDSWPHELAPSPELRRWYGHDPDRWEEFGRRYRHELATPERRSALAAQARRGPLTLLTASRAVERSNAMVVRQALMDDDEGRERS